MMRGALAVLLDLGDDLPGRGPSGVRHGDRPGRPGEHPDVALLDIELPGRSGLDAAADLAERRGLPRRDGRPSVGPAASSERWLRVRSVPGQGRPDRGSGRRHPTCRRRRDGRRPAAGAALPDRAQPAHARRRDVLAAAEDGATVADIAAELHLSCRARSFGPSADAIGRDRHPQQDRGLPTACAAATAGSDRRHVAELVDLTPSRRPMVG